MKIQLDFNQKTVSIEENVNIHEFYKAIKNILPEWKEWNIQSQSVIYHYYDPIPWKWNQPYYTGDTIGAVTLDVITN